MKLSIEVPEGATLTATSRNVFTGADGVATTGKAGDKVEVEIDSQNQVVLSVAAVEGEVTSPTPLAGAVKEPTREGGELQDASDADVSAALALLHEDEATARTNAGYITTDALNAQLESSGYKPVTADRRTQLSDAGNYVKA